MNVATEGIAALSARTDCALALQVFHQLHIEFAIINEVEEMMTRSMVNQ